MVSDSRRWLGRGRVLQMMQSLARSPNTNTSRLNVRIFGCSRVDKRRLRFCVATELPILMKKNPTAALEFSKTLGLLAIGWKLVSIRDAHSFLLL